MAVFFGPDLVIFYLLRVKCVSVCVCGSVRACVRACVCVCVKELGSVFGDTLEFCVADNGAISPDRVKGHLPSVKGCEGVQVSPFR